MNPDDYDLSTSDGCRRALTRALFDAVNESAAECLTQMQREQAAVARHREDGIGRPGLTPLQKCTVAIRQLAYGTASDMFDEYLHVGETTGRKCLKTFCKVVVEAFGDTYLRRPTADDCQRLMRMHETVHGFPGMLGSIVCMHWQWKNCPTAWRGQFTSGYKGSHPTMILEAVADHRLWIWHAYLEAVADVMYACIIMHNMIAEQELGHVTDWVDDEAGSSSSTATPPCRSRITDGLQ
ncbi:uncharacterized protein LOC125206269 [Salvia hispanica]|uniref:uncharacterized protein LOC125206269 n=1 Tax=Salvia hispanica TaxID=49212 RepID=UPI002009582C|nr:uncharacterized protein LOC125206269 [Salvia hispanica]